LQVPQILHRLGLLSYSRELAEEIKLKRMLPYGSSLECSIRAGSVVAVEDIKEQMEIQSTNCQASGSGGSKRKFNSVLIDFFLWDLAKLVESGKHILATEATVDILPCHRTRSIYY